MDVPGGGRGGKSMRVFTVELKRFLRTRSVQALLIGMALFSALLAYFPISFVGYTYKDESGAEVRAEGLEAIGLIKEHAGVFKGEVTGEVVKQALVQYQETASRYEDGIYDETLPSSEKYEKIFPVQPYTEKLSMIYKDFETGEWAQELSITEEQAEQFYEQCKRYQTAYAEDMAVRPEGVEAAAKMYEKIETPWLYYPGIDGNCIDYITITIFLIAVVSVIIMSPMFADDRQTKADQILKCTRYGKGRLAVSRVAAGGLILTVLYAVCMTVFLLIMNTAFGWESLETSVQMVVGISVPISLNLGQLEVLLTAAGFVTLLATASFTLYLSGKMESVFASSVTALVFLLLPALIDMLLSGAVKDWLRCILPSGGVGLSNSFVYTLWEPKFAYAAGKAIWLPYLMMGAALIEIPVFAGLTVWEHCRRRK